MISCLSCWLKQNIRKTSFLQGAVTALLESPTQDKSFQLQQNNPSDLTKNPDANDIESKQVLPTNSTNAQTAKETEICNTTIGFEVGGKNYKAIIVCEEHSKVLMDEQGFLKEDICPHHSQKQSLKANLERENNGKTFVSTQVAKIEQSKKELAKLQNFNKKENATEIVNQIKKSIADKIKEKPAENEQTITKSKTYTIITVGATGVGKSTLIGGIANYLKFNTFENAVANVDKIETCIPIQFTVLRKDGSKTLYQSFAEKEMPENEKFNDDGQSITQKPEKYEFHFGDNTIRVIDTPGLEDTRGSEQDQANVKLIKKTIEEQDEIHAICIVVKSNQSKLTSEFEMTIRKLLSIFPKTALKNVFFFFSFSVGTFFAIGDVIKPLEELKAKFKQTHNETFSLEGDRTYCIDSESFKYLLCKQQEIQYSSRTEEHFETSWDESAKSVNEFFNCLKTVEPIKKQEIMATSLLSKLLEILIEKQKMDGNSEALNDLIEKLKFMVLKHALIVNKSEITTKIENLSKNEFLEAMENVIKITTKNDFLAKCKTKFQNLPEDNPSICTQIQRPIGFEHHYMNNGNVTRTPSV
uniref:AIG1-type G domain-containing protein n=1 Tax=Panagrolaimus sp. JU765 TaxID=591449 RepID=A0AC34RKE6_9BILA